MRLTTRQRNLIRDLFEKYERATEDRRPSDHAVLDWAIASGIWQDDPSMLEKIRLAQLQAFHDVDQVDDGQGKLIPRRLAVPKATYDEQGNESYATLWPEWDIIDRDDIIANLGNKDTAILLDGDKRDKIASHYNSLHADEEPLSKLNLKKRIGKFTYATSLLD
jgi:hypothetical protein